MMGNKWMCFYKRKPCGRNTTCTSVFHVAWAKNNKTFNLPATYEFLIKTGTSGVDSSGSTEPDSSLSYVGGDSSATKQLVVTAKGLVNENRQNTKVVLDHYKDNAVDSDISTFVSDLQTAWGLN